MTAPGQAALSVTFTWDWRQQPPMEAIGNRITELTGGAITFTMPPDTGSDDYELTIAAAAPAAQAEAGLAAVRRQLAESQRELAIALDARRLLDTATRGWHATGMPGEQAKANAVRAEAQMEPLS